MDLITKSELERLVTHNGGTHVSIFLPTERAGAETRKNPIRFKNLLRQASELLEEHGLKPREVTQFLDPAADLVDDHTFWQHQEEGLAVFLADGFFETYRIPLRFDELATVEERFHLKSLFPLFNIQRHFYILALSQKHVRLFEGTRYAVREVPLEDVPESLAEALGHELTEPHLQFHTGADASRGSRGTIFHGQGAGEEGAKAEIRKFFNVLDRGLEEYLGDRDAPLVLAGVDYLLPIYREASSYPNILEEGVPGNPDDLTAETLHAEAWQVVQAGFRADRHADSERFGSLIGTGKATSQLSEAVPAALDGRIDTLFVARGIRRWGRFDPDSRSIQLHQEQQGGSEDLLDLIAVHTFLKGGTVYDVEPEEVPGEAELAAVFRW